MCFMFHFPLKFLFHYDLNINFPYSVANFLNSNINCFQKLLIAYEINLYQFILGENGLIRDKQDNKKLENVYIFLL